MARLEQSVAKAQHLRDENQSLARALDNVQATEQQLRTAAADALAEVDQAIALIAAQASTEGERVEPVVRMSPPAQEATVDAPDLALSADEIRLRWRVMAFDADVDPDDPKAILNQNGRDGTVKPNTESQ